MLTMQYLDKLKNLLYKEEDYKQFPYRDSNGILTIGIGRNLQTKGINKWESQYLLANDIQESYGELQQHISWFKDLDEARQCVLIDMTFNMGIEKLLQFKITLDLIAKGQYAQAATEMLNSKWHTDVGNRAERLAQIMRTGQWI